ncbi:peptide ABC transporter substrate-binding protein SapA [Aliiglaciecola sp. CAU 1673]|uniref:ABC transporter substrate-binding protein SapA n=1 Tax=Aliiglaciecola sp. CAU 1673 TaxID=3032595 RepID=UPI0023DA8A31|nr:ABC transporter substrate-binding protein SapA [Aliiglaciecola sp. CAU 1673]MDF2179585.1 peptide ABC transporter substrate-binding protein SapA [Aliiglaciecola sp. CAU 1673]
MVFALGACQDNRTRELAEQGLIYCSEGNPLSFNPQLDISGTTVDATSHQVYNRLLDFDSETGKVVPNLATSWLVSEDGLTYTFQLRKDVAFHSTAFFKPSRPFNADDVLFSINRWRLKDHPFHHVSGGSYPYFDSLGLNKVVVEVNKINGYRVEIKLSRPDSSFLATLATDFSVILSQEYAEQLLAAGTPELLDTQPVGTGPFQFVSFREDNHVRYHRNPDYWGEQQTQQQLIYDITPSSSMRLAKLITGECDVIAFPAQTELRIVEERGDLILDEKPGLNIGFWAFNTAKPPFNDARVRKALTMAVDKRTLIDAVYFDSAIAAKGLLPPTSWAFDDTRKETHYNPVMARQLLDEAGIGTGFTMDIWAMPVERAYNPNATKMAEIMQNYLQQVGVKARIVSYEWGTFRRLLAQGQHDSVLIGWTADSGDPDNFYRPLLSCSAIASGTNRANWCSEEYDDLIDQALAHTDENMRLTIYRQANDILEEQMPLFPIAHAYRFQAYRKEIKGLTINPFGGIQFAGVVKESR